METSRAISNKKCNSCETEREYIRALQNLDPVDTSMQSYYSENTLLSAILFKY